MIPTMILLFVVGYLFIALEHKTRIDKSAVALLMAGAIWTVFSLLGNDPHIQHELVDQLGDTCEILVFLIGAMTIVDLIDSYGGFNVITDHITTRNKRKLMWLLAIITFFMSAALDNMTTTIIMVMLLRRLIANKKERWIFASVIVIAANSGGAWAPIGDVTTIMLWMRGNVTAANLIANLFLPCLVSVVIPAAIASRYVADRPAAAVSAKALASGCPECIGPRLRLFILIVGVVSLLFVPVFKSLTGLPPYMGMMVSLGFMWILTEIIYDRKRSIRNMEESIQPRVSKVLKHIDMPTILFFLGILMAVGALQTGGVLTDMADWLDKNVHEVFTIAGAIGILSSVVDNVPLVAACMGMYPVADVATAAASADPAFAQSFVAAVLAPADLLRRRGRQSADHRLGGRRRGDGTRKDQFRLVPQTHLAAGPVRLSGGHRGDLARTRPDRALTEKFRMRRAPRILPITGLPHNSIIRGWIKYFYPTSDLQPNYQQFVSQELQYQFSKSTLAESMPDVPRKMWIDHFSTPDIRYREVRVHRYPTQNQRWERAPKPLIQLHRHLPDHNPQIGSIIRSIEADRHHKCCRRSFG